ncbi:SusC/RagA family TonB-linked outer membrane protein [Niastella yeongjuensis]|uniref:SusC/RagA family TonB-linked outer membrane protein n=1 Tax=Niastella yeongjuensis TaxID=354355 RepID=A0A1V9E1U1_9BACT|nr:TonB-dependent receptor [Niastella yeongjuensis]OQP40049.1 SusC/RagA family TonB-linked outer membrane protein [Niastella yeongjuensis]SEO14847.1 TonB-linked outer membrane protein, SusC/RagA family [Niastella yeongjuensis]
MNKLVVLFSIAVLFLPGLAVAQDKVVTGTVKDANGPLAGATVAEKQESRNAVAADSRGHFRIILRGNSGVLVFSYLNYQQQEVNVKKDHEIEVIMQQSVQGMEEMVVVGFGKKKRITNTGAVSSINAAEIRDVPTSSVQNALAGKLPGFFTQQRSGQPGKDASDYFIRGVSSLNPDGNQPLIVVDDIQYTYQQLAQINVNEIESISILKDASTTAIYGIKGANGVLVVTTRRGAAGKPKFNVRMEGGAQAPVRTPKFLDSYHTAELVNEAYTNDGLTPVFSQADLDAFKTGNDPYGHPDVNWYKAINRPYSLQGNSNLDISGGTSHVKYFISGGAFSQSGSIRNFSTNTDGVNSNYFYKRYNVRSNLDIQATKNLTVRLDATVRFGDINQPYAMDVISNIYDFSKIHPYSAPFINPDGSWAYAYDTEKQLPTINAQLASQGYKRDRRTDYNVLLGFTEKLDDITPGLSLTGRLAYASVEQNNLTLFRTFPPSYHYDPRDNSYHLNTGVSTGGYTYGTYRTLGNTDIDNQRTNVQVYLNYDRVFAADHHFSGLLLWNQESYRVDVDNTGFFPVVGQVPHKYRGYSLKVGYDYKQKYLIDFNGAFNGSDRFQASKRNGFFPAVGVGWNMAKEEFFDKLLPAFSLFKLRATYGIVGSDVAPGNQYLYNQVYNQGGGYSFGQNNQGAGTIYEGALGTKNVTWEKAKKFDAGLDVNLFNDKISLSADYFHEYRYDQLVTPGNIQLIAGIGVSPTNVGITVNRGWEETFNYHDKIGNVQYSVGLVWSYAKNKILYMAEASPRFPWLAKTGHSINQPQGYLFNGFYSEDDIADPKAAKPVGSGTLQAGDLKYKDLNGDGIIDQNDITNIGKPNLPNTTIGLPIKIGYKGFDASVLFQGAFGYSLGLTGTAIEPFKGQFQPLHEDRWTPATAATARFPRLTTNPTTINSPGAYNSDFWVINAHYIRLKTVELSYILPRRWLPLKMNNGRLYLSAYNLATWSNVSKKYQADPEVASNTAGDAYLAQRVINIGLQLGF